MNEQQLAYRIRQSLNQGIGLDAATLARLKASRELALARQKAPATSPALFGSSGSTRYRST